MYVCQSQRVLRARRRHRPADLALSAAALARARSAHANRGVAVAGDRLFMVTDDAHLLALNRFTGELLWDTTLDDWRKNYSATSAPLAGGQPGRGRRDRRRARRERVSRRARSADGQGSLALLDGAEARRAGLGDLAAARTSSTAARRPGSPAATTPSSTWSTGRPGTRRRNTTATIARATTSTPAASWRCSATDGKLKWHYQFTPHDLWDWDATQTSVLVDAQLAGQAAQADAARQSQRLLLRVRSHRRQAAAGEAVHQDD